jgi:hypothetical protein
MGAGNRLRLRSAVIVERCPDARERGEGPVVAEREPNDVLLSVSGFGSGAYSAKELNGTRQRFSGFNQPRQCGDEVLRILVTGGPPVRGGGGSALSPARGLRLHPCYG